MPREHRKVYRQEYPLFVWKQLRLVIHGLLGGSDTACANAMGMTRSTWRSYENRLPPNPWIVHDLYWCCWYHFHDYTGKKGSKRWVNRSTQAKRFEGLRQYFGEGCPPIYSVVSYSGCEKHLARLLSKRGMYFHDIRRPANAGGYSPGQLRMAARKIGVTMTQKGFGEDNESWWEWPDQPDEY